jgi:hypothetical protein
VCTLINWAVSLLVSNTILINVITAVPWFRQSIYGLSPQRTKFTPKPDHVEFVVEKVGMGQIFL